MAAAARFPSAAPSLSRHREGAAPQPSERARAFKAFFDAFKKPVPKPIDILPPRRHLAEEPSEEEQQETSAGTESQVEALSIASPTRGDEAANRIKNEIEVATAPVRVAVAPAVSTAASSDNAQAEDSPSAAALLLALPSSSPPSSSLSSSAAVVNPSPPSPLVVKPHVPTGVKLQAFAANVWNVPIRSALPAMSTAFLSSPPPPSLLTRFNANVSLIPKAGAPVLTPFKANVTEIPPVPNSTASAKTTFLSAFGVDVGKIPPKTASLVSEEELRQARLESQYLNVVLPLLQKLSAEKRAEEYYLNQLQSLKGFPPTTQKVRGMLEALKTPAAPSTSEVAAKLKSVRLGRFSTNVNLVPSSLPRAAPPLLLGFRVDPSLVPNKTPEPALLRFATADVNILPLPRLLRFSASVDVNSVPSARLRAFVSGVNVRVIPSAQSSLDGLKAQRDRQLAIHAYLKTTLQSLGFGERQAPLRLRPFVAVDPSVLPPLLTKASLGPFAAQVDQVPERKRV